MNKTKWFYKEGNPQELYLENAKLIYKNFSGIEGEYNAEGERDFSIMVDSDEFEQFLLSDKGSKFGTVWNVKYPKPKPHINPEDDHRRPSIQVKIGNNPRARQAQIVEIRGDSKELLEMDRWGKFDWIEPESVDLILYRREYDNRGRKGTSAYLVKAYITMPQNPFMDKHGI